MKMENIERARELTVELEQLKKALTSDAPLDLASRIEIRDSFQHRDYHAKVLTLAGTRRTAILRFLIEGVEEKLRLLGVEV